MLAGRRRACRLEHQAVVREDFELGLGVRAIRPFGVTIVREARELERQAREGERLHVGDFDMGVHVELGPSSCPARQRSGERDRRIRPQWFHSLPARSGDVQEAGNVEGELHAADDAVASAERNRCSWCSRRSRPSEMSLMTRRARRSWSQPVIARERAAIKAIDLKAPFWLLLAGSKWFDFMKSMLMKFVPHRVTSKCVIEITFFWIGPVMPGSLARV